MSYSRWKPPTGKITIKPNYHISGNAYCAGRLIADTRNNKTWFVFDGKTGIVEAIFYAEPNQHGWSPSKAHAQSFAISGDNFNPFELDNIT